MCAWPGQLCKETTGIQAPPLAPFSLVSSSHREVPLVGASAAARHERELRLLAAQALEQRALEAVPRKRAARAREAEGLLKGGGGRFVLFWGRRRKGGRQFGEKRRPVRRRRRRRREGSVFYSGACAPPASLIADEKQCCLSSHHCRWPRCCCWDCAVDRRRRRSRRRHHCSRPPWRRRCSQRRRRRRWPASKYLPLLVLGRPRYIGACGRLPRHCRGLPDAVHCAVQLEGGLVGLRTAAAVLHTHRVTSIKKCQTPFICPRTCIRCRQNI